jgi:aspartate ammonia-lyase
LEAAGLAFAGHVEGIKANPERCAAHLDDSPTLLTAFLPKIGYERAEALVKEFALAKAQDSSLTLRRFLSERLDDAMVNEVLSAPNLLKLGHE